MDLSRFLQAARQGCVDAFWASRLAKDSPSAPPAPDYTGAAVATSAGNLDAARVGAKANRVSQYTPYGNLVYTPGVNGDIDQWRSDISLSPTGKQLLDYSNQSALGLGQQQNAALGRVNQSLSKPFDASSVGELADQSYAAQTARLDPQWEQNAESQQAQLANQGLAPGGEAYDNAMRTFNQGRNDAYTQARLAAQNTMPQTYQLANAIRSQPLNELNALRTGSQVQNPTFQQAPQQQTTTGPNYLQAAQGQYGAANDVYNSGVGQANSFNSGLMNLAGTAASMFMLSDRRLKRDIQRVGTHPLGIGLYEWTYVWGQRARGVMADEVRAVMPAAVVNIGGFDAVDYALIGG